MDGFNVTKSTVLCQEHFKDSDIKRNPQRWKLHTGVVPSLKLYSGITASSATKSTRKAPKNRNPLVSKSSSSSFSESFESNSVDNIADVNSVNSSSSCSVSTQTDFSFVKSPLFLDSVSDNIKVVDHDYSQPIPEEMRLLVFVKLQHKIDDLNKEILQLNE